MGIDLTNLSPAPWSANGHILSYGPMGSLRQDICGDEANAAFIALARNAFDVMMRRGWTAKLYKIGGWGIIAEFNDAPLELLGWNHPIFTDPFTALVEADSWCKANVEKADAISR